MAEVTLKKLLLAKLLKIKLKHLKIENPLVAGLYWRCGSELNRSKWFCRPLPNRLATAPYWLVS